MKSIVSVLLLLTAVLLGQDSQDIRTEIKNFRRTRGGSTDIEIVTVRRKEAVILKTMKITGQDGVPRVSRGYFVEGRMTATESDDNGDGFFETLVLHGDRADAFEVFVRRPDGTINPLATDKLEKVRREVRVTQQIGETGKSGEARAEDWEKILKKVLDQRESDKQSPKANGK